MFKMIKEMFNTDLYSLNVLKTSINDCNKVITGGFIFEDVVSSGVDINTSIRNLIKLTKVDPVTHIDIEGCSEVAVMDWFLQNGNIVISSKEIVMWIEKAKEFTDKYHHSLLEDRGVNDKIILDNMKHIESISKLLSDCYLPKKKDSWLKRLFKRQR